tara:strand:- start:30 stop:836 length:807 start_codon:yes stop_codon:yes gene_type:complete
MIFLLNYLIKYYIIMSNKMSMSNKMRMYRLVDYPKPGYEYGNFESKQPYQAAHKIINFLDVSNDKDHSMVKFWMREYIPLTEDFLNLIKYIKKKLVLLNEFELKNILILFFMNLLIKNKHINKKNIKNINLKKHINLLQKLNKKELFNLISILLITFYKENKFKDDIYDRVILNGNIINGNYIRNNNTKNNIINKKLDNISHIKSLLKSNLKKINNFKHKNKNIDHIIINNSNNIKIPKVYNKILINIYIDYKNNNNHIKRLSKNLTF